MQSTPKARTEDLVVQQMPDEVLVYDLRAHKAHCLNKSASLVWERCDGNSSLSDIEKSLVDELGAPMGVEAVALALEQLGKADLIDGYKPSTLLGLSRRQLLKRGGIAAGIAVALPLVSSIVSPTAVMAATRGAPGTPCSNGFDCVSGICNGVGPGPVNGPPNTCF